MDWTSDSERESKSGGGGGSDDDYEWDSSSSDSDPEYEVEEKEGASSSSRSAPTPNPQHPQHSPIASASVRTSACDAETGPSRPDLMTHFIGMGFPKEMVAKAIKHNEDGDMEAILETLLAYAAIEKSPSEKEPLPDDCSSTSEADIVDEDFYVMDDFPNVDPAEDFSKDRILSSLVEMGFPVDEASSAIDRCGPDASFLELADSIRAAQMAGEFDSHIEGSSRPDADKEVKVGNAHASDKRRRFPDEKRDRDSKRGRFQNYSKECMKRDAVHNDASLFSIPNPMVGFSLPNQQMRMVHRKLPEAAIGPPYFYYENVALAPKGVWETISRFLYDVEPEFVDSKYFCAAARKRGYVHNLPIQNRFPLLPRPAQTIQEALPQTKKWWPSWDPRTQLNCLQTCIASSRLTERIRTALTEVDDPPPLRVQQYILNECRKWNLVWVGLHKVAPLEPDEIEMLLGFPRDHTRGGGISRTERYRSLGNSFQVDTVAYHLSVLKGMFPNGITMLSLFSGIGGAEVALHRLGIRLKTVVSVEVSEINRNIVRGWWEQTEQTGTLIEIADVQQLNGDRLEQLIGIHGGFDLVIGGSPCNNLAGSNRYSRDGLEGFPRDHTRGGGTSRTERYRSLGNLFQVDTVAYNLSVLKGMFPNGITMLSLFSGIGGAEVALHRLGIHLKTVVSVEVSEINRNIVRGWWEQTEQTGTLIEIADVQQLNGVRLEQLISIHGGFDLVIGVSPCNNLAGSNHYSRDGLEGFPRDHTRGGGISRTERYSSLGNSFQVDTVAYNLSVLKGMFPNGITMLSLFSGIGGAEVALHRLGFRLKTVVSVEVSEINRNIVRGWWEQTEQTGTLIEIGDVQQLNGDRLEQLISIHGGFDLVIGGSPCNNLAGSNRYSRDGLEGKHSFLFYDYFRILDHVKRVMGKNF